MRKILIWILTIILLLFIPALYGCRSYHNNQENENIEETASQVQDVYEPINYMALEKEGHKILSKDICLNPKSVYEDSWLLEQLENELRLDREMMEDFGTPQSVMEYFLFDLNSDGVDEYIVSLCGSGWIGSSGNTVIFLSRNEEGKSNRIWKYSEEEKRYDSD